MEIEAQRELITCPGSPNFYLLELEVNSGLNLLKKPPKQKGLFALGVDRGKEPKSFYLALTGEVSSCAQVMVPEVSVVSGRILVF